MKLLAIFGLGSIFNSGAEALFVYLIILYILPIIALWKIFEKAGQPGWAAIIPLYSLIVYFKVIGKSAAWIILFLIPIINIIFIIMSLNLLSKSFGKDEGFTFGLIIFGPLFLLILAFGSSDYIGPMGSEDFRRSMYQKQSNQIPINVTVNTPVNMTGQPQTIQQPNIVQQSASDNVTPKSKFCTKCGTKIANPNARFCISCGAELT